METSGFGHCTKCRHMRECFAGLTMLNATLNALAKLEAAGDLRFPGNLVLDTTQCFEPRKDGRGGRA